jgi:hypothetical protein
MSELTRVSLESLEQAYDPLKEPVSMLRFLEYSTEESYVEPAAIEQAARYSPPPELNARYSPYGRVSRAGSVRSARSYRSARSSAGSNGSANSRSSRKGRRRFTELSNHEGNPKSDQPPWGCTFCDKAFKGQYEWNRHEEGVHVPRESWICNPADIVPPEGGLDVTLECRKVVNFDTCLAHSEEARTFHRRDHLVQHLRQVHRIENVSDMAATIHSWQRSAKPLISYDPALHCGFCGTWLENWQLRVVHVSNHIKHGSSINDWWPGRLEAKPNLYTLLSTSPFK